MEELDIRKTDRGFAIVEFTDRYGNPCSLQGSSLATEDAIWLGDNEARMHLTQETVAALLPLLEGFVNTGEIQQPRPDPKGLKEFVAAAVATHRFVDHQDSWPKDVEWATDLKWIVTVDAASFFFRCRWRFGDHTVESAANSFVIARQMRGAGPGGFEAWSSGEAARHLRQEARSFPALRPYMGQEGVVTV